MDKRDIRNLMRSGTDTLGRLVGQAKRLDEIDRLLARVLDAPLASQVRAASTDKQRLLLISPSAAVANRLRLDSEALLERINREGSTQFTQLEVRIAQLPQHLR